MCVCLRVPDASSSGNLPSHHASHTPPPTDADGVVIQYGKRTHFRRIDPFDLNFVWRTDFDRRTDIALHTNSVSMHSKTNLMSKNITTQENNKNKSEFHVTFFLLKCKQIL